MTRSRWIAPSVWAVLIELLTSWPSPPSPAFLPPGTDKVVHFSMYAVFAFLVARAMQSGKPDLRTMALVTLALGVWAALDEAHQLLIPGRSADLADWTADSLGVAGGLLVRRARPGRSRQVA